jgi:hypothetical protein
MYPPHLARSYALEKLGKYFRMLEAGMHILVPFIDEITFTRCLKTGLLDCPPQVSSMLSTNVLWLLQNLVEPQHFLLLFTFFALHLTPCPSPC